MVALARARSRAPLGTRRRLLRRHVVCERKHVRPAADADAAGQHEAERGGADAAAAAARRLPPERTHTRTRTRTRVRAGVRLRASGNAQVAARVEGVEEQRLREQNGKARPGARSILASAASSSSSSAATAACCGTLRGRAAAGWGRAA